MKNTLIIFEGMDGSGKTTQMEKAFNKIFSRGLTVRRTREPGGTPLGEEIRKILKSDIKFSTMTEAYLFAASRSEHNIQILKWIKEGDIVLCDRHFLSSYAYQGTDLAIPINKSAMETLENIDYKILCFDVNYENYRSRVTTRNEASDRFEDNLNNEEYFNHVRNRYLSTAKMYDASIIDTNDRDPEDIHEQVMEILLNIIEEE